MQLCRLQVHAYFLEELLPMALSWPCISLEEAADGAQ